MTCPAMTLLPHLLIVLAIRYDLCLGLRITRMVVPSPVVVGEAVWLECDFKEEAGENVYALKWYLGLDEFYRWTPLESPSVKTFPVNGTPLVVDTAISNRGRVRIKDVKLGATGLLRCEVSEEAPSFHTESDVGTMTVLDLPDEKPVITGVQAYYEMHEYVHVNCSSARSQPPATLTFYINNEPVDATWLKHYPPMEDRESGLETAVLGLEFRLRPHMLRRGPAILKCTAAIQDRYWETTIAAVRSNSPSQVSLMEGRASAARGCAVSVSRVLLGVVVCWRLLQYLH